MELLTDKVIYHTETQEDYDDLMERLKKLGCKWLDGENPTCNNYWDINQEYTCICLHNKNMTYDYYNFFKRNYTGVKITKYKKEQNPMKVKLKANDKFVADWYEAHKSNFDDNLCTLIGFYFNGDVYGNYDDLYSWIVDTDDCIQTLVKMHLFGYELEKEPLYYVVIPNPNVNEKTVHCYCLKKECSKVIIVRKKMHERWNMDFKLTESEIKEDFEWAWDFARKVD